jgi:hypothetical protein
VTRQFTFFFSLYFSFLSQEQLVHGFLMCFIASLELRVLFAFPSSVLVIFPRRVH